jgi:hypothetical protein
MENTKWKWIVGYAVLSLILGGLCSHCESQACRTNKEAIDDVKFFCECMKTELVAHNNLYANKVCWKKLKVYSPCFRTYFDSLNYHVTTLDRTFADSADDYIDFWWDNTGQCQGKGCIECDTIIERVGF